jgi:hypothetical protein
MNVGAAEYRAASLRSICWIARPTPGRRWRPALNSARTASRAELLSDDTARFVTTRSATGSGHRREAAPGNTLAHMTVHLLVHPHATDLWQSIQRVEVSIDRAIWSMKCLFEFGRATCILFCTMRPKGNGAAPGSEWIAEARFETGVDDAGAVAPRPAHRVSQRLHPVYRFEQNQVPCTTKAIRAPSRAHN